MSDNGNRFNGVQVLEPVDGLYPSLLKQALGSEKSPVLYAKGDVKLGCFDRCLAVVGSRRMTKYGRDVISKLVREIVQQGVTIVSGFMYGVDLESHRVCLEEGGRTIAVMPCGVENVFPRGQERLYEDILSGGGIVLSEYLEDIPAGKWCFPRRNRIVAGISSGVLVIEAGLKSGSLITAGFARKYGRDLFAVPGSVYSTQSAGTLQLISEGAKMARFILDLYGFLDISAFDQAGGDGFSTSEPGHGASRKIYDTVLAGYSTVDGLCRQTGLPVTKVLSGLTGLCLSGLVEENGGRYFVVRR
jgi:DNA processing protein